MKRLKSGDKVVAFSRDDYLGNKIDLIDYKGKKILLVFFRAAPCPFCNLRVHQLISGYADFRKKRIEIIALFAATQDEISQYAGKQKAPFPIVPDPGLEVYNKYGIEQSRTGLFKLILKPLKMIEMMGSGFFNLKSIRTSPILPAEFLIDENQYIHRAYYGKDFSDHLPIAEILNWER